MRGSDADDYSARWEGDKLAPGPLFAQPESGPFARSEIRPEPLEALIAGIIWRHAGREHPVSIAEIIRRSGLPGLSERKVKEVVEQLRVSHRCAIGAKREAPAGYFRIVDAEDLAAAIRPYVHQIRAMARVARALLTDGEYREFVGQLRLEELS